MNMPLCLTIVFSALIFSTPSILSAQDRELPRRLTDSQRVVAKYTREIARLKQEIIKGLPLDPKQVAAYQAACKREKMALAAVGAAEKDLQKVAKARALVDHAKTKWIGGAEKGIAESQERLKNATTDKDREAAQAELANWQKNKAEGLEALKQRQAVLDQALAEEPSLIKAVDDAKTNLQSARADTIAALSRIGKDGAIAADALTAFLNARKTETDLETELKSIQSELGKINGARGLVGHAKNKWIGEAVEGIAKAQAALKAAKTEAARAKAMEELSKWKASKAAGEEALKERQAALDRLLPTEPALKKKLEEVKQQQVEARAATQAALNDLQLNSAFNSNALDDLLVKYVVMYEATPKGLADFVMQGDKHQQLIEELLADTALMKQMLIADGAMDGHYGQAMTIYSDIKKASNQEFRGIFQRLALAVSLQHATPVKQRNPAADKDAPAFVDPVKRYLSYERAYLAGELDPAFKDMNAWELRMVVYGSEPDTTSAWGRKMLRSYRPDHIANPDYNWRYVAAVRTDVPYCHGYDKHDKPDCQFYQNIIMNGGVCGRRAFFGRFILRAFGIPTTARPQPGHAALAHWTPDGWVLCFGAGWGSGWTKTRYRKDRNFLATTQARESEDGYMKVKRAQWIGDVFEETPAHGLHGQTPGFWYGVSLYVQRGIIDELKAEALAAVGEELGEANESNVTYANVKTKITDADRNIVVEPKTGIITIPAAACTKPTKSTKKILLMPSNLGGKQLHYNRVGKPESFEYAFDAPTAGKYALVARVITVTPGQLLRVKASGSEAPVDIALPFTLGLWETSDPVILELKQGKNALEFSRIGDDIRGLTIKEFTLSPVN